MDNFYHSSQNFLNQNLARYPALAVGLPLVGGFISSSPSARTAKGYYESLDKSSWAPSPTVFGPVWTGLYLSIGYASHLVALHTDPTALTLPSIRSAAQTGLGLYGLSLALNFAWTPIFFWKKQIGAALVTAGGVFSSAIAVSYYFFKVDKAAGYLTLPYIAWLGYATALNYDIWIKNAQGPAADHARKFGKDANRLGKDVGDAARHAKSGLQHEAKQVKDDAKDAARSANRNAKSAVNDASDRLDRELR
ncbi:TspO/MBR family-domain-containing protein [Linnemannia elongata]|nr:TspO/MBR family-domain-containing protein [Linnemannia elongata]